MAIVRWSPLLWQDDMTVMDPPYFTMVNSEDVQISIDPTELLIEEQAATNPDSTLQNLTSDSTVELDDPPEVVAGIILQRINGLIRNSIYKYQVSFNTGNDVRASTLYLRVL